MSYSYFILVATLDIIFIILCVHTFSRLDVPWNWNKNNIGDIAFTCNRTQNEIAACTKRYWVRSYRWRWHLWFQLSTSAPIRKWNDHIAGRLSHYGLCLWGMFVSIIYLLIAQQQNNAMNKKSCADKLRRKTCYLFCCNKYGVLFILSIGILYYCLIRAFQIIFYTILLFCITSFSTTSTKKRPWIVGDLHLVDTQRNKKCAYHLLHIIQKLTWPDAIVWHR